MAVALKYKPVVRARRGSYHGAALVGCNSVILGWNVSKSARPKTLLGFAVRRTDLDPKTKEVLRVDWLNGQKRFKDSHPDLGTDVRSDQAPFQRFRWSDYSVNPGRSYRYEVFPMAGKPGDLRRGEPLTFDLRPSENLVDGVGVYANRGVTAAMAYLQHFHGKHPEDVPDDAAYHWLERGLKKSLLDFIAAARKGERLHVCIYEFFDEEVAEALRVAAKQRKVKVEIVFHAKAGDKATKENRQVLGDHELRLLATDRTKVGNISHNKFVVHLTPGGTPKRLWTGSANFSENAFYFQTNVALRFESRDVAAPYEEYFQILKKNPKLARKKAGQSFAQDEVSALNARVNASPPSPADQVLYSPVRSTHVVDAAIALIGRAKSAVFLSAPFGVGKEIVKAIDDNPADILEYGLANTTAKKKIEGLRHANTRFFTPSRLRTYMGRAWDAKAFGAHKIHAKTLVIDPWGPKPAVLIGSANFSEPSCTRNDENTLPVEGDKRFAVMVASEFLRMYDHYKIRFWINQMEDEGDESPIYLDDTPRWSDIYFRKTKRSRKFRDREVFSGLE